jgi:hypothetical protein
MYIRLKYTDFLSSGKGYQTFCFYLSNPPPPQLTSSGCITYIIFSSFTVSTGNIPRLQFFVRNMHHFNTKFMSNVWVIIWQREG